MKRRTDAVGNLDGLQEAVEASGLAAIVIGTPENVRYAGDVAISTMRNIRHRPAYVLWPARQDPVFVVAENELARIRRGSWIERTECYQEFITSAVGALARALTQCRAAEALIGCELQYMPAAQAEELRLLLPGVTLVGCDELLRRVRRVKTPRELEILARGSAATERAIQATFASACAGEDEHSLMRRLCDSMLASGAERIHSAHIYGGPNAGGPHMGPTGRKLQQGDLVKADLCGVFDGYVTNVGRTAVVGGPSPQDQRAWAALHAIHRQLLAMVRPGATGAAIYRQAQALYAEAGFPLRHPNNGHGIGLEVHERPQVGPREDIAYAPGMVTTIESRVKLDAQRALHIEDTVQVTEGGHLLLTGSFPNEDLFIIQ